MYGVKDRGSNLKERKNWGKQEMKSRSLEMMEIDSFDERSHKAVTLAVKSFVWTSWKRRKRIHRSAGNG